MKKLISFIVPVYNVEKYIKRCLLSIVSQGMSSENFELIVINDGSTDSSLDALLTLKEQYPFIQIISTENHGLSAARNEGLKIASGRYIFFIDSDDWIEKGSLAILEETIEERDADIILFGIREVYDNGIIKELNSALSKDNVAMSVEEYSNDYTIRSSAWNALFKRQLFIDSNYQFREGFFSEDDDFVVKIFSYAKSIICLRHNVYNYYQRKESISNNSKYESNKKLLQDRITMLKDNSVYIGQFEGLKYSGLKRKLDFCAVDIFRLLFRKNINKNDRLLFLASLKEIGFYPLPRGTYGYRYSIFRYIVNNRIALALLANSPFKKYI